MRWKWPLIFFLASSVALGVYYSFSPSDVEPMGNEELQIAKYSLWAAIAGAAAGLLSVVKELIGLFKKSDS